MFCVILIYEMADERPRIFVKSQHDTLTSEQRAGFVIVAVTSVMALVVGVFYMARTLHKPFDISYTGPLFLSGSEKRALEVDQQKTKDTDSDGLTDYDELYIHRSSPYLKDTDGDGISDVAEVNLDETKSIIGSPDGSDTPEIADGITDLFGAGFYVSTPGVDSINQATAGGQVEDLSKVTPGFLRDALRAQGATEEQLRYVTDQQLMERYLDALKQYQATGTVEDTLITGEATDTPTSETTP